MQLEATGKAVTGNTLRRRARGLIVASCAFAGLACTSDPGYKGRSSADWIGQLERGAPNARVDAAFALGHVLELQPNVRRVVRALSIAVRDTSDEVRIAAAVALRRAGERARDAVPGIAEMLKDSAHANVRRTAAVLLGDLGRYDPGRAVPPLERALADGNAEVRLAAGSALGRLGRDAGASTPALTAASADPDPGARVQAIDALSRVGFPHDTVATILQHALADSVTAVRVAAIQAIARFASEPSQLAQLLGEASTDREAVVRLAVVNALSATSDDSAHKILQRAAKDFDPRVQQEALHILSSAHRPGDSHSLSEPSVSERCLYGGGRSTDKC